MTHYLFGLAALLAFPPPLSIETKCRLCRKTLIIVLLVCVDHPSLNLLVDLNIYIYMCIYKMMQRGVKSYRCMMQWGVKSYRRMMQRGVNLAAGSQV
jgi:hypothetical protein